MTNYARELSEPSTITDIGGKNYVKHFMQSTERCKRMTKNILPHQIATKAKALRKALQKNQISESIDLAAEIETLANKLLEEGKK